MRGVDVSFRMSPPGCHLRNVFFFEDSSSPVWSTGHSHRIFASPYLTFNVPEDLLNPAKYGLVLNMFPVHVHVIYSGRSSSSVCL